MLYIVMLIFQLVGALILLFTTINGSKKEVISNCFPGSNVVIRDDSNNTVIPKEQLQSSAIKIYLSIVAFADLFCGYSLAAFSPLAFDKKCVTVATVIGGSIILALAEFYLVKLVARIRYSKDEIVTYEDLAKMGVDTVVTNREIEKLFEESDMK